jgi:hypothetical protein
MLVVSSSMKYLRFTAPLVLLVSACVPKSEHLALAREHELLEAEAVQMRKQLEEVGDIKNELSESQKAAREAQDKLNQQKLEAEQRAKAAVEELEALKKKFEQFKVDRRTGMVGKKLPDLALSYGKTLIQPEIREVTASTVRFVHSGGISEVRLADLGPDLRWEAVFDENEAEEHEARLAEKREEDAQKFTVYKREQSVLIAATKRAEMEKRAKELTALIPKLRTQLSAQRRDLNNAFRKKSPRSSSGWNSGQPENSEMLTDPMKRSAIVGISELEKLADAVRATKQLGSAAIAELATLKSALAKTKSVPLGKK